MILEAAVLTAIASCRYGSPSVLDQWLGAVVADESELRDSRVHLGDLVGVTVPKE